MTSSPRYEQMRFDIHKCQKCSFTKNMYLYHFIRLLGPRFLEPVVFLTAKFQQALMPTFVLELVIKEHSEFNPSVFVRSFHRCSTKSFTSLRTESFAHNGIKSILNPHLIFFSTE